MTHTAAIDHISSSHWRMPFHASWGLKFAIVKFAIEGVPSFTRTGLRLGKPSFSVPQPYALFSGVFLIGSSRTRMPLAA